eukprot:gene32245-39816_t
MWFKIAPDSVYVFTGHSATFDRGTGVTTSSTEYTCQFTRVIEAKLTISDEEIQKQEKLKADLMMKTKRVSSSEHRDDMRVLRVVEQSIKDATQFRADYSKSHEVILPVNDIDWNDPEIDSFLDHIALDDDTLFFDSSENDVMGPGEYASAINKVFVTADAEQCIEPSVGVGAQIGEGEITSGIFSYENLQDNLATVINGSSAVVHPVTLKEALTLMTSKPTLVKNIETFTYVGTFSVDIGKDGKYCHPEVICSLLYVGEMESNPMGPNSRVYVGVDILIGIFAMWFKVAPDSVYVFTGHSATYDRGTSIVTSNTEYTWQFTRVMEMNPKVSDEEIAIQEKLKTDLLKTKRVSSSEHRDDMRVLSALEQSLEDAAQFKNNQSMAGNVKSHEVLL